MPSAFRNPQNLQEWLQLDSFRRSRGLGRWKSLLVWITLEVLVAGSAAAYFLPGTNRLLQAGPVSAAHTFLNGDCASCHTEAFQIPKRLFSWNDRVRTIPNEACNHCHIGSAHNDQQLVDLDCASCHREHRGRPNLSRVPDGDCTTCHADLKAHHAAGEGCPFEDVASFPQGHPEFALWRDSDPHAPGALDPGQLHFNHAVHLSNAGLLLADGTRKKLDCNSCHDVDDAGRYMLPIHYEHHCKACHPLAVRLTGRFEDPVLQLAAERFAGTPAPHSEPALVRAVLRDRLLEFVRENPVIPEDQGLERVLPKARWLRSMTEQQWTWARRELLEMEKILFATSQLPVQEHGLFRLSGGCAYRHLASAEAGNRVPSPEALPQLLPTNLRRRWLPHSRFRHAAHRMMDCAQCHTAATSSKTSDILMPHLETCTSCHNAQVGARHDCVECHQYHRRGHAGLLAGSRSGTANQ